MGQAWAGQPAKQVGTTKGYNFGRDPSYNQALEALTNTGYNKPFDPGQYNQYFEQGVADPTLKYYEERIRPGLQNSFYSPSGVYGSALNQALNTSASDLATNLGALRANYLQQGQQQHQQNQYSGIASALGLTQSRLAGRGQPIVQGAQSGWLQDILKGLISQSGEMAKAAPGIAAMF